MRFLTRRDIDERRAQNWEEANVYSPNPDRQALAQTIIVEIEEAFAEVKLGNGVGLLESKAIDDYATLGERNLARKKDETEDWKRIEWSQLNDGSGGGLSFFDAEGMRFHLPAYLICDLRGKYEYHLSDLDSAGFKLLNGVQKEIVARYLEFVSEDIEYQSSRLEVLKTLDLYRSQRA